MRKHFTTARALAVLVCLTVTGVALGASWVQKLQALFSDGTAAAPSQAFSSDPDTGAYRAASNTYGVSGGGAAAATFTPGTTALKKTTATNVITSDTTASVCTASVPAVRVRPTATLDANDMVFEVSSAAGASLFSVDLEGDVTAAGSFSFSPGDITMTGGDLTSSKTDQTFNVVSATASGTASTSVGAITLAPSATLDANDLVLNVLGVSAGSSVYKVDLEGDSTTAGNVTFGGGTCASTATTTELFTSATSAANASASVAAFTFAPTATLDADDDIIDVKAVNAGSSVFEVDKEGDVLVTGRMASAVQTLTVADSGDGNAATATLTPSSNMVVCVCNDTDGCTITLSETGAVAGSVVRITNSSTNACGFADTGGVTELASGFTMGQWDSLTLGYFGSSWVELGRSNN